MKKKIYIPHLHYTVKVRQFKPLEDRKTAKAYVLWIDTNSCELYMDFKKPLLPGNVAHELIHVLQNISEDRGLHFARETEHFGYLMHYLMGEVMGYKYK